MKHPRAIFIALLLGLMANISLAEHRFYPANGIRCTNVSEIETDEYDPINRKYKVKRIYYHYYTSNDTIVDGKPCVMLWKYCADTPKEKELRFLCEEEGLISYKYPLADGSYSDWKILFEFPNGGLLELVSLGHAQLIIFDYDNSNNIIKKNLDRNHSYNEVPIIADIDGDNYADVIYQVKETNDGYICAIDRNGNEVGSINLYTYGTTNDGLIAADVDNDGLTEIVTGTSSARFYIWETKGNASCIEWGSARGNAQNTGEYGLVNYPYLINNTTDISSNYEFEHDIYIVGGSLDITGNLTFPSHRKIVVWENGVLNINDATLNNACIIVKSGGKVNITNGSTINLRDEKSLVAPKGARLNILQGVIK